MCVRACMHACIREYTCVCVCMRACVCRGGQVHQHIWRAYREAEVRLWTIVGDEAHCGRGGDDCDGCSGGDGAGGAISGTNQLQMSVCSYHNIFGFDVADTHVKISKKKKKQSREQHNASHYHANTTTTCHHHFALLSPMQYVARVQGLDRHEQLRRVQLNPMLREPRFSRDGGGECVC